MTKIRRLISSITGRFVLRDKDYAPGDTVEVTQRRGSYLTAGDRQKLSSALGIFARQRHDAGVPPGETIPLERAVLDLLTKTE